MRFTVKTLIWRIGLRGPSLAVYEAGEQVQAEDKKRMIGQPIELRPAERGLTIRELLAIYTPPMEAQS